MLTVIYNILILHKIKVSKYGQCESSMISPHFNLGSHWSSNNPPLNCSLPLNHWITNGHIIIECGVTVAPRLLGSWTLFFRSQHFLLSEFDVIRIWSITSHLSSKLKGCTGLWDKQKAGPPRQGMSVMPMVNAGSRKAGQGQTNAWQTIIYWRIPK